MDRTYEFKNNLYTTNNYNKLFGILSGNCGEMNVVIKPGFIAGLSISLTLS